MIYFTQDTQTKAIKIGYSKNPTKRRAGLQSSTPSQLVLLGCVPGGLEHESAYHEKFAAFRLHGEWFKPDIWPAVLQIIAHEAASPSPVTTSVIVAGDSDRDFIMSSDPRETAKKDALECAVARALDEIHAQSRVEWVIIGGERQVEVFAARWARRHKVNVYPYYPNWKRYGRGAPAKVGRQMLRALFDHKILLVFPGAKMSTTIRALIRQAEKAGIEVIRKERSSGNAHVPPVPSPLQA
jgi:hypothetical protein